jgi:transglutaminase-like putative cysteine protease
MMRFALSHVTRYAYSARVDLAHHVLHLDVPDLPSQAASRREILCTPAAAAQVARRDHFGNLVTQIHLDVAHDGFEVRFRADGVLRARRLPEPVATPAWASVAAALDGDGFPDCVAASEFALPSPLVPAIPQVAAFARPWFPPGAPILVCALALTREVNRRFSYDPAATHVATPLARAFEQRAGVCQDFAHIEIAALRGLGLAARYVSGYLATRPPPGAPPLRGTDASHAWVSVWCGPEAGWIDLDPTNDCAVGERHLVSAFGRDYGDVSPVRGVLTGGGAHSLAVEVDLDLFAEADKIEAAGGAVAPA